ncbi:chemotaxis protein CheD [Paucidesulfovibrio longus]|uniref:chemotaxis protein CheD n=1 Tax=Paucidesulfovibrio longus TaxID=889 RepID=UPI000422BE64|nr:chemotaxis protein CheD [Paucidesulfovibrio longus]
MDDDGRQVVANEFMLGAGCICLPSKAAKICAVVGSGAVVAVWDRRRRRGGMTHYARPYREPGGRSTAMYAAPAIVTLVRMLLDSGSSPADLETHLFGGASNRKVEGFREGLGEDNVKVGLEILEKLRIRGVQRDVGGTRGRKVVFNTGTGEVVLAKVERIRASDWYPQ